LKPVHGSAPNIAGKGIANPLGFDSYGGYDASIFWVGNPKATLFATPSVPRCERTLSHPI